MVAGDYIYVLFQDTQSARRRRDGRREKPDGQAGRRDGLP